ncbi:MAG: divergent polysaccharide deacetylase family protein [Clostridiales bacterium]|nr:divergent polysaccharide deacetylase family protein [Clostridiales bacterium]
MKKKYSLNMNILIFVLFAAFFINFLRQSSELREAASQNKGAYIAIIIDDFGGGAQGTEEFLSLPIKFTGAVMPFQSQSEADAALLKEKGNDVLVHLPMEAKKGKRSWLGDRAIFTDMTDEEITALLNDAFGCFNAAGANNHMGSKATEDERAMSLLFRELKDRDMLFVDSMTTPDSLSGEMAEKFGIKLLKRDVFLDSTQSKAEILENLNKTKEIAKKRGYAVCIGHVGAEGGRVTAEAVKEVYEDFEAEGIRFVTVSQLAEMLY